MCGISGIFDRSGAPVDQALLERMNGSLGHRGPDGAGMFIHKNVGLGHRRLSIIDLSGGAQPIGNEDGTIQVVFNGEIYNYVELQRDLMARGHVFRTRSDTEVIVHAYEQWGEDFVNRFNGMFSFALFDVSRQELILARDHLGIKPLYYTRVGEQLLFASEIKSLLQHSAVRRDVDHQSLAELFTFRYVPSPKSLISGIFKLPPGHLMKVNNEGVAIRRFWTSIPKPRSSYCEQDLIEEYQDLLEDAVRLQLRSDVPLGLFLSSGIDSGVLLALMSQQLDRPVEAFTIDFEGGENNNEGDEAARIAARYGAHHHRLCITARDYESYFERYMQDIEEPVGHESAPAFYFVSMLAKSSVKVALTGQGVDEPWAGYGRHIGARLSQLYCRLPEAVTRSIAQCVSRIPLPAERIKRGVLALSERDTLERFIKIYSFFTPEMKSQLYRDDFQRGLSNSPPSSGRFIHGLQREVAHLDPLSQLLYIDTRTNLPDDLLMVGDKTSMANSIELRVPFLDSRLVEFVETLPPRLKLRGTTGKYLHKKALLKWLPKEDVYKRKIGFANPISHWMRTSMRPLVEDCLLDRGSMIANYFDQKYIRRILDLDRERKENYTRHIYLLLSLELWHRAFARPA